MQKTFATGLAIVGVVVALSTGCATTQEYAGLAQVGSSYAVAVDRLLVASRDTTIDATSNRLLQDPALSNLTLAQYQTLSGTDRMRLEVMEGLRLHADLLGSYFRKISMLTGTATPADVRLSINRTVDGLSAVGKQLRETPLLSGDATSTVGPIRQLAVSPKVRTALRNELDARQTTIRQQLVLQERLLKALAEVIGHDLHTTAQLREARLVGMLLTQPKPVPNPDQWVTSRRNILLTSPEIAELQSASRAAGEMREIFEDLVAGHLSMGRLRGLIADLESIMSIAEHLLAKSK